LNFYFNVTIEQGSDGDSTMVMVEGREVDSIVFLINTSTPNAAEVQLLHHPPRIFKRNFNPKWKIGRTWLYHLKPAGGPIVGIMKCEACQDTTRRRRALRHLSCCFTGRVVFSSLVNVAKKSNKCYSPSRTMFSIEKGNILYNGS
jgi:hypothetical protein